MSLNLSGYLPAKNGLEDLAPALLERFESAYADGDDSPVQVVVVGVLNVESVKHRRNPADRPPVVEVRFSSLEPAKGTHADALRLVLVQLAAARNGETTLDGIDEALAEMTREHSADLARLDRPDPVVPDDAPGVATTGDRRPPGKSKGAKSTRPTTRPFEVVRDEDPGADDA